MSLGISSKLNILQQSPHDLTSPCKSQETTRSPDLEHWVPSRYNIRAVTGAGELVLWNSYKGTMSVFQPAQRSAIEALLSQRGFEARSEGAVQYLVRRGFLIKAGTDEYRRVQLGFGQQHYRNDTLELILLASEDCNFRCTYCYEEFARGTMRPEVRAGVKKLVQRRLKSLRSLSIRWFGGEPLYGLPAIEELAPFFLEAATANGFRFSSNMTTNGYLLTPDVAEKLLAWDIRTYQITLDGAPEDHDCSRPGRDGSGTFAQIFANLKDLTRRKDDFLIDIRVNFDQNNHPNLTRLLDLVEKEFRNDSRFQLLFRPVGRWGGPNDDKLQTCGVSESAEVQARMREEAHKRGLKLSSDIRHVAGMGAQVCYAARPYNFIVGASGKLMKCTIDLDMKDRNVVGRLRSDGNLVIDEDKMALWTEPAFERDKKCQKCVVLPTCQGLHCPQVRMDSGDSPCTPLRMGAKQDLLAVLASSGAKARAVTVKNG